MMIQKLTLLTVLLTTFINQSFASFINETNLAGEYLLKTGDCFDYASEGSSVSIVIGPKLLKIYTEGYIYRYLVGEFNATDYNGHDYVEKIGKFDNPNNKYRYSETTVDSSGRSSSYFSVRIAKEQNGISVGRGRSGHVEYCNLVEVSDE